MCRIFARSPMVGALLVLTVCFLVEVIFSLRTSHYAMSGDHGCYDIVSGTFMLGTKELYCWRKACVGGHARVLFGIICGISHA